MGSVCDCGCYLCYDRQDAHHSYKDSKRCGGEVDDLQGEAEVFSHSINHESSVQV